MKEQAKRFVKECSSRKSLPFSADAIACTKALTSALFDLEQTPVVAALAFWLRPAHIQAMKKRFEALLTPSEQLLPRGIAFHIPPANVDTLFVYSWILSLLAGNANIVRLPSGADPSVLMLLDVIGKSMPDSVARSTLFVDYGYDPEMTQFFSSSCDVRVLWGGDSTIETLKQYPIPLHAKELVFPDRTSVAAIEAVSYLALQEEEKERLVDRFFHDLFLFDQSACSSPRALYWIGKPSQVDEASSDFYRRVRFLIDKKGLTIPLGAALKKKAAACHLALEVKAIAVDESSSLTLIYGKDARVDTLLHPGFGLLYHLTFPTLEDAFATLTPKVQTLSYFGFLRPLLQEATLTLPKGALDRIVPIGQALQFHEVWDGLDLIQEFSRRVTLQ